MTNLVKNRIYKTELVDISGLTPFQGKLKTLSEPNFNKLRKAIIEEGFCFSVHVWQSGDVIYIIDGHQRIEVMIMMRKAGDTIPEITCSFIEADTYHDAKKLVLLAVSQYGKVDNEGFLDFIDGENFDLGDFDLPDFAMPDIVMPDSEPNEKDDEVPDVVDNPYGVKRGDVWVLGDHRVICGDSTSEADVSKLMDGEKAEMVFTDPPYNQETKGGREGAIGGALMKQGSDIEFICNFDPEKFLENLPIVFSKNKMNSYLFCNKDLIPDYLSWAKSKKYSFNILVWKKPNAIPIGGSHRPDIEYLLLFRKSAIFNGALDGVNYSKLIEHGRETGLHPTMKPIDIITNQLQIGSKKQSLVVDFFLGSGSTLIACEKTNRKCYGMELDEHYCSVIIKRWEEFTGLKAIKGE
jgi:DNA modification methylase